MKHGIVGGMLLLGILVVAAPAMAAGQEKVTTQDKGKTVPVTVNSDHLDIWEKKQQALFTGHVHMVRGDFELYSDSLLVYYLSGKQGGGIDHALAKGHVRMIQGDKKGTSDSAVIDNRKHLVTLRGHAVMEQAGGRVAGETIVHDTETKTTQVFQGKDGNRVSLRINEKQMHGKSELGTELGATSSPSSGKKAEPAAAQSATKVEQTATPPGKDAAKPAASPAQDAGTEVKP